jgi:hypothetical protein
LFEEQSLVSLHSIPGRPELVKHYQLGKRNLQDRELYLGEIQWLLGSRCLQRRIVV